MSSNELSDKTQESNYGAGGNVDKEEYAARLKTVEKEFVSFYEYCKEAGFSREEMEIICSPLESALRQGVRKRLLKITFVIFVATVLAYQLFQFSTLNTHAVVLSRILLLKVLPIWDWRHIFYDNCLIQNPFYQEYRPIVTENDCASCETVEQLDHVRDVTYDFLLGNYLMRDAPVVVTDALEPWSNFNRHHFSNENITQLYTQDERLIETVPCALVSNLRTGSSDLLAFLKRMVNPNVGKWFVHWQNCDINAVKVLRKLYLRPYFLPNTIAPAHFNWVLMSSGYTSSTFKRIELDTGLIMLAQLKGSTVFRLSPLYPCNSTCVELMGDLLPGEMLIFNNHLWSFEYYPGSDLENIAILTETVWDDRLLQ